MQKAELYTVTSKTQQGASVLKAMKAAWVATDGNTVYNFPQPSEADIDAERHKFPLVVFECACKIVSYGFEGSAEEVYAVAVIKKPDGFLATALVDRLKLVEVSDAEL